jgi:hypothetical protein
MEERWEIVAARYDSEYNICVTYENTHNDDLCYVWYFAHEIAQAPALAVKLADKDAEAYSTGN